MDQYAQAIFTMLSLINLVGKTGTDHEICWDILRAPGTAAMVRSADQGFPFPVNGLTTLAASDPFRVNHPLMGRTCLSMEPAYHRQQDAAAAVGEDEGRRNTLQGE